MNICSIQCFSVPLSLTFDEMATDATTHARSKFKCKIMFSFHQHVFRLLSRVSLCLQMTSEQLKLKLNEPQTKCGFPLENATKYAATAENATCTAP